MKYFKIIKLKKIPVILHIPHASTFVSRSFRKNFLLSDSDLNEFSKKMADLYADDLYSSLRKKTGALISCLSRVVVDVERFWDNKDEAMADVGMGALYEKNEKGKTVRKIDQTLLVQGHCFYKKYHEALNDLTAQCLKKFGYCIILDCHTYPAKPRQYDLNKAGKRPDICLGTDKFHTPKFFTNSLKKNFLSKKFSVSINSPFKGSIVPDLYFKKNKKVFSLMIEINRRLYMNESDYSKKNNFEKISRDVTDCIFAGLNEFINKYDR